MGLQVNGKDLNVLDKEDISTKHYLACVKELLKYCGGKIELDFSKIQKNPYSGRIERATSIWWENRETIKRRLKDGTLVTETWIYYDNKSNDGTKFYVDGSNKGQMRKKYVFTENSLDLDKMFFLIFISPRCELIQDSPDIMKLQNVAKQFVQKFFKVYNESASIQDEDFLEEQRYKLLKFLRETATETQLRVIAEKDCNIPNASQEDLVKLRTLVTKHFINSTDRLRAFDPDKYTSEMVELRNTLNEARDLDVIKYVPVSRSWNINKEGGKSTSVGGQIPKEEKYKSEVNRVKWLYDLCKNNNAAFNQIRDAVEQKKVDVEIENKSYRKPATITESAE